MSRVTNHEARLQFLQVVRCLRCNESNEYSVSPGRNFPFEAPRDARLKLTVSCGGILIRMPDVGRCVFAANFSQVVSCESLSCTLSLEIQKEKSCFTLQLDSLDAECICEAVMAHKNCQSGARDSLLCLPAPSSDPIRATKRFSESEDEEEGVTMLTKSGLASCRIQEIAGGPSRRPFSGDSVRTGTKPEQPLPKIKEFAGLPSREQGYRTSTTPLKAEFASQKVAPTGKSMANE